MWDCHGHRVSGFGVLMFGILHGVCVLADTNSVTLYRSTGGSLDLTVEHSKELVDMVTWTFNEKTFAEYNQRKSFSFSHSQFTGRLKEVNDKVGVTIQDLQLQDSGTFRVIIDGTDRQYPTNTFIVYVQNPITAVQIEKNQTWHVSTNSCDVNIKCAALGAESVSYLWRGYKTTSGAQLQFSLSPAEGNVTLNCTAVNNVSSSSATHTLSCNAELSTTAQWEPTQYKAGGSNVMADQSLTSQILWILGGVAFCLLIIIIIIVLVCCWRSHKGGSVAETETTVYADINDGTIAQKNRRSDSVINGMTVYETVDDLRMKPEMTIYAKVTLPQLPTDSTTNSTPYRKVC